MIHRQSVIKALLEAGASLDTPNSRGQNAIEYVQGMVRLISEHPDLDSEANLLDVYDFPGRVLFMQELADENHSSDRLETQLLAVPDSFVGAIAKELQEKTGLAWGADRKILTLSIDDERLRRDLKNIAVKQRFAVDIKNLNILRIHGLNEENLDKLDNVVDLDNLDDLDDLGSGFIKSTI